MIRLQLDANVLTITMDRPARLNAFTVGMHRDLMQGLRDASRNPAVRAVVLTGAGKAFCAGFDMRDGHQGEEDDPLVKQCAADPAWNEIEPVAERLRQDADELLYLHNMPKVTIAMMRGAAAGGGLCLAAACDFRIASENAVFKTAFSSLGRCGDPGGSYLISKLVGGSKARELYLLDEKIDAARALSIGLVSQVVPDDKLEEVTQSFSRRIASGPTLAQGYIKRNINAAESSTLEQAISFEAHSNVRASLSHDGKEAATAFMEKRAPAFRGY